jgi:hypothetical protein
MRLGNSSSEAALASELTLGRGKFLHGRPNGIALSAVTDLIGLLANPNESGRDDVPPLRATPVQNLPVQEFIFAAQVVLRQHFSVSLELFGADRLACQTIEDLR